MADRTSRTLSPDTVTAMRQSTLAKGPPTPAAKHALAVLDHLAGRTLSPEHANQVKAAFETLVGADQVDRFLVWQQPASIPLIASSGGLTTPAPNIGASLRSARGRQTPSTAATQRRPIQHRELQSPGTSTIADQTALLAFSDVQAPASPVSHILETSAKIEPPQGDLIYLGMGPNSLAKLRAQVGDRLVVIQNSPAGDGVVTLEVNGEPKRFNLSTKEGLDAFIDALELKPKAAGILRGLFVKMQADAVGALDELGQLAVVFAEAEKGERNLGSLVLSGHSSGQGVSGYGNGTVTWADLATLCAAFPGAAAQVKHIYTAACNNGRDGVIGNFLHMFPNMETMWAYNGAAPNIAQGGANHLQQWWSDLQSGQLKPSHPNVYLWRRTSNGGVVKYRDKSRDDRWPWVEEQRDIRPEKPVDTLPQFLSSRPEPGGALSRAIDTNVFRVLARQAALDGHADLEGLSAECWRLLRTGDASEQQMRTLYARLLDICDGDQDVNAQSGQYARELAERMIRLIHFHEIRERFAGAYGGDLAAANQVLGQMGFQHMTDPAVSHAQLNQTIAWLEQVVASSEPNVPSELREALRLLNGLRDMDPDVIPAAWV